MDHMKKSVPSVNGTLFNYYLSTPACRARFNELVFDYEEASSGKSSNARIARTSFIEKAKEAYEIVHDMPCRELRDWNSAWGDFRTSIKKSPHFKAYKAARMASESQALVEEPEISKKSQEPALPLARQGADSEITFAKKKIAKALMSAIIRGELDLETLSISQQLSLLDS